MGNQLIKGYSIQGEAIESVGCTRTWKIYKGKQEGTHNPVSIFVIDKKVLKKNDRDELVKIAKKEASSLARVRHPGVLALVEPLTEDENILAYVTERIESTLCHLIASRRLSQHISSELELKLALYPFLETLIFLHENVKQAHLAISLESIFMTADGKLKLAGFGQNSALTSYDLQSMEDKLYDLSYAAPELALHKKYSRSSDMFSIGVVLIKLLEALSQEYKPLAGILTTAQYEKNKPEMQKLKHSGVIDKSPKCTDLRLLVDGLMAWEGSQRWLPNEMLCSAWMNDQTVLTTKYLDKITSYEVKEQLEFLKGLAGVMEDFDQRVALRIIYPRLIELLKFGQLIASIIYILTDSCKNSRIPVEAFRSSIWPHVKTVTQGKEMTAQSIYLLVKNMEHLEKYVKEEDMQTAIMPLYLKCFECPPKLKQLALSYVERLSKRKDYQFTKTKIIPKILLTLKDPNLDTRKDSLRALLAILCQIDSQTIASSVLPGLEACRKAGSDPFVNAISNHIYNSLAANLNVEIIGSKILPTLIPYLTEPAINRVDFELYKNTILNMISKIEKEKSRSFDMSSVANVSQLKYSETDFKFASEETHPTIPKSYSFLNSYVQTQSMARPPTDKVQAITDSLHNQPVWPSSPSNPDATSWHANQIVPIATLQPLSNLNDFDFDSLAPKTEPIRPTRGPTTPSYPAHEPVKYGIGTSMPVTSTLAEPPRPVTKKIAPPGDYKLKGPVSNDSVSAPPSLKPPPSNNLPFQAPFVPAAMDFNFLSSPPVPAYTVSNQLRMNGGSMSPMHQMAEMSKMGLGIGMNLSKGGADPFAELEQQRRMSELAISFQKSSHSRNDNMDLI